MRISDWSSDVCSSDLLEMQAAIGRIQLRRMAEWTRARTANATILQDALTPFAGRDGIIRLGGPLGQDASSSAGLMTRAAGAGTCRPRCRRAGRLRGRMCARSEEHTSELQSLMRISYAVFCLKKKKITTTKHDTQQST